MIIDIINKWTCFYVHCVFWQWNTIGITWSIHLVWDLSYSFFLNPEILLCLVPCSLNFFSPDWDREEYWYYACTHFSAEGEMNFFNGIINPCSTWLHTVRMRVGRLLGSFGREYRTRLTASLSCLPLLIIGGFGLPATISDNLPWALPGLKDCS